MQIEAWVLFTLLAAAAQVIRTGLQKKLAKAANIATATYARYVFGLPWLIVYVLLMVDTVPTIKPMFYLLAFVGGLAQITATIAMLYVMDRRNFAVGSLLAKTDALVVALVGTFVFMQVLSRGAWLSIVMGFVGVFVMQPVSWQALCSHRGSLLYGFASGVLFAATAFVIYFAKDYIDAPTIEAAAIFLLGMVCLQTLTMYVWIVTTNKTLRVGWQGQTPLALRIGLFSAIGSIGWFTGMSLVNPAYVKALGQIEIVLVVLVTWFVFKERISAREFAGIILIGTSVLFLAIVK